MKSHLALICLFFSAVFLNAQVQVDKPVQMTGGNGDRSITGLELPVNGTDAANKDYVDAQIANIGGGSFSAPNMTTSQRDNLSPSPGDIIFNTDQECFNLYNGNNWIVMCNDFVGENYGIAYDTGNDAYWNEKSNGYRDIYIRENQHFYTWSSTDLFYSRVSGGSTYILIPDKINTEVNATSFYGYSGGIANSSNFQWDGQTVSPSAYDVNKLFVSPGGTSMNYCKLLDNSYTGSCNSGGSTIIINAPTVYGMVSPGSYATWSGAELFSGGSDMISEQSLESGSYCTATYGKGWRIPTDDEVGHTDNSFGAGHGYHIGYEPSQVRTSSQFQSDPTRRWHVNGNTIWENDGYTYSSKEVRCVYAR